MAGASRRARRQRLGAVNILVDSCSYNCQNVGDLAMLTVAVSRLRELWPSASITVITNAPDQIARHCGEVDTVPVRGRRLLLQDRLLGPARRWLPGPLVEPWERFESRLVLRRPRLFAASLGMKAALGGRSAADVVSFLDAIRRADLVVVNGAGIMTDAFADSALGILATLELAIRRDVPTALFGQGLGPIANQHLWRRASEVLPLVTLIGVRESETSVPLLSSLGVNPANVIVTGDDALEMAFSAFHRRRALSRGTPTIGVNVRVASYADVEPEMLSGLRSALESAARTHDARMTPIPIAHHGGRMDVDTLRGLLTGLGDADGGASLDTPQLVIDRIGECRLVVTGSYHGAVFALAQGIPVVALVKSAYYVNKMAGLQSQFGVGCEIVRLDDEALSEHLVAAIDRAWADADRVCEPLLQRAADQIQRGRAAYARLREVIRTSPPSRMAS
jgi:polysaccharide pyruvyl transferase WcaK-like protein